jgi:phosphohistidine phosphatase
MNRTLVLLRHGEAESETGSGDHARRLTKRGQTQATATGEKLARTISGNMYFLISDAVRARETFSQFEQRFPHAGRAEDGRLYLAGLDKIKLAAQDAGVPAECETVVVVGHNPGLSMTLATLTGDLSGLHTADAAILTVDADSWQEAFEMNRCWDLQTVIRG